MKNINEMDSHVNQNESSNQVLWQGASIIPSFHSGCHCIAPIGWGSFFLCTLLFCLWVGCKSRYFELCRKKGYVFKTYEGILIMEGFRTESRGTLQSNQFVFSVDNANLADSLM